jgi:predicted MFS family arabinose efflux permease
VILVYAIVKAQAWGWTSGKTLGLAAFAVALLAAFVAIEQRSKAPLVRLGIFRNRSLTGADTAMVLVVSGMFAMFFFATLYIQQVLGYSPLKAGLSFLPVTAGIMVGAALAQKGIQVLGPRYQVVVGIGLAATGMFFLSGLPAHGSYAADLLPGLMLIAVGMGLTFVPITLMATTGVADSDAGLASGLLNTAQQVGGALGLAILSTVAADHTSSATAGLGHAPSASERTAALVGGFTTAFTIAGVLMVAGAIVLMVLVRKRDVAAIVPGQEPAMATA